LWRFNFYFVSDHEPDVAKMRTPMGKGVTFILAFAVMQHFRPALGRAREAFAVH